MSSLCRKFWQKRPLAVQTKVLYTVVKNEQCVSLYIFLKLNKFILLFLLVYDLINLIKSFATHQLNRIIKFITKVVKIHNQFS